VRHKHTRVAVPVCQTTSSVNVDTAVARTWDGGEGGEGGSVYVQLVRDLLGVHHPKKTTHWRHTIVRQHDHSPNVAAHTQEHTHHTRTHAHAHTHTHTHRTHSHATHTQRTCTHTRTQTPTSAKPPFRSLGRRGGTVALAAQDACHVCVAGVGEATAHEAVRRADAVTFAAGNGAKRRRDAVAPAAPNGPVPSRVSGSVSE
jgi:hypothetical protein